MIIAECKINLKLHSASGNHIIHDNFLSNVWSSAYVRTNCAECYTSEKVSKNSRCSSVSGIQIHVTTTNGEKFPWVKSPFIYDVICNAPSLFAVSYIKNVELHNFRHVYDSTTFPHGEWCNNNRGFRNHRSAASGSAGTYLTNVSCTNCDEDGKVFIMEPREAWRGWFGGCGQFDCTGMKNVLI
jgi:hypothetical protein